MVPDLARDAATRLKEGGRIVVSVSSPDNLVAVQATLEKAGMRTSVRMIQISRGLQQLDRTRFEPLHPTFLVFGQSSELG